MNFLASELLASSHLEEQRKPTLNIERHSFSVHITEFKYLILVYMAKNSGATISFTALSMDVYYT